MNDSGTTRAWLQTPSGKGGIAVIALAGPLADDIVTQCFRPLPSHKTGENKTLQLGKIVRDGQTLDEAVIDRTDNGYEMNIHGGPAVARAVLAALSDAGAKATIDASRTAFAAPHPKWNNPAIAVEMLAALSDARSTLATVALSKQWSAGLSQLATGILVSPNAASAEKLTRAAERLSTMQRLLHPAEVVLAGAPNAGKSTLANALTGQTVSIVHHQAGTTRDWVRELAVVNGVPIWLTDTAGIWETPDALDAEAVRRARYRIEQADLVLLLGPGGRFDVPDWLHTHTMLKIATKCDESPAETNTACVTVSAVTGEGLDALAEAIVKNLGMEDFDPAAPAAFTARQAECLNMAAGALRDGNLPAAKRVLRTLLEG